VVVTISTVLIVLGTLLFLAVERESAATPLAAFFASVTTRTAGFNTVETGSLAVPTLLWMMIWMFIGASPGSTGGGTKTTTFATMFATLRSVLTGRDQIELHRTTLPETIVRRSFAIFFLAITWIAVAAFLMTAIGIKDGGPGAFSVIFETVSAFGTVGLSMGATAHLTAAGKLILVLTMFAGRIGPLTLILSLARRKEHPHVTYPEQAMAIG
jgi:trk system potassium uptake protein TrkH